MSPKKNVRTGAALFRSLAGVALVVSLTGGLTGCGAEKQTPVAAPASGGEAPGGASVDEYRQQMQKNARSGGGGGGPATIGTPPSGGN